MSTICHVTFDFFRQKDLRCISDSTETKTHRRQSFRSIGSRRPQHLVDSWRWRLWSRRLCTTIRKVFDAQKRKPVLNDWVNIIKKDCEDLNIILNESQIGSLKKYKFKSIVKEKIRNIAFKYLMDIKESQSKLSNVVYKEFKIQKYLKSDKLSNDEKSLLFRIRTRTVDEIKTNFRNKYGDNIQCRF